MQYLSHLNLEFKTERVDNLKFLEKTGFDIHNDFKIELEYSLIAKFFKISINQLERIPNVWTDSACQAINGSQKRTAIGIF